MPSVLLCAVLFHLKCYLKSSTWQLTVLQMKCNYFIYKYDNCAITKCNFVSLYYYDITFLHCYYQRKTTLYPLLWLRLYKPILPHIILFASMLCWILLSNANIYNLSMYVLRCYMNTNKVYYIFIISSSSSLYYLTNIWFIF